MHVWFIISFTLVKTIILSDGYDSETLLHILYESISKEAEKEDNVAMELAAKKAMKKVLIKVSKNLLCSHFLLYLLIVYLTGFCSQAPTIFYCRGFVHCPSKPTSGRAC